jgi:hypothetical protein
VNHRQRCGDCERLATVEGAIRGEVWCAGEIYGREFDFDAEICVTAFILSMYFNNIGVHGFVLTGAPTTPKSYD